MKKYSLYKPSGIEWLEGIPEHWEISKLKYLGELYGGLTGKSGIDFNNDENPKNKPYIPYTNILNNTYISKDHFHYVSIDEGENQNLVLKNDLFFLMSSETYKDLGKSCILIEDVDELYLNSFCKGYRIKNENIFPLFLNYQIIGHLHRELISTEGKGFTRINLRQDKINDLVVFFPSLSEQHQIVIFLDEKTEIIDKLISTKQRKIDLLKEQRTSLINQVITKGLNPNVKMKDSGVEWIREIPEHWEVKRLKYLINITDGIKIGPFGSSIKLDTLSDFGIKIYGQGNVIRDDFSLGERYLSVERFNEEFTQYEIIDGDVLITMMGTTGKCKVFTNDNERGILDSHLLRLRFNPKLFNSILFSIILEKGDYVNNQIKLLSKGSIMDGLNSTIVKELTILTPPIPEQVKILEYININTKEIDDLVSMEQKKIDLLKEYRQSLISEVITGKIDVRTNLN